MSIIRIANTGHRIVVTPGVGPRGPRGPAGEAGSQQTIETAGEAISGRRVVRKYNGKVYLADSAVVSEQFGIIGITTQAAIEDGDINVQSYGQFTDSGFAFLSRGDAYLNGDGTISETAPTTGFYVVVGKILAADTIMISPRSPITLA